MERYNQYLEDIRKSREDAEKYRALGLTDIANAFDTVVINITVLLSAELEQNQSVIDYKSALIQEKAIAETKLSLEQNYAEVQLYKQLHQTF